MEARIFKSVSSTTSRASETLHNDEQIIIIVKQYSNCAVKQVKNPKHAFQRLS